MEKASVFIVRWLTRKNILPKEDEELYAYAVHCLLITVSPLFLVLFIGACLGLVAEGIILIIPFMDIRSFSGGIHSESPEKCFVLSTGILLVLLMMTKVISNSVVLSMIVLGSSISLIICSPIENENKQLSDHEKKAYKKITGILVCTFTAVYFVLSFLGQNGYAVCIALGVILTSALQFPCLISGKLILK